MFIKTNSFLRAAASAVLGVSLLIGCGTSPTKSPDVSAQIRKSLDQAGLKEISVDQDRDKGVVTLTGTVTSEADKAQAESIAKSIAGMQVVADQIGVRPIGEENRTKQVDAALDAGIEENLKAALIQGKMTRNVKYDVKNRVVTLTGTVNSQARRNRIEQVAAAVPNVVQVVNELQVRDQTATSSD
jgi:hyperosmotically inducible protein